VVDAVTLIRYVCFPAAVALLWRPGARGENAAQEAAMRVGLDIGPVRASHIVCLTVDDVT
jgi:hypothetical protein